MTMMKYKPRIVSEIMSMGFEMNIQIFGFTLKPEMVSFVLAGPRSVSGADCNRE